MQILQDDLVYSLSESTTASHMSSTYDLINVINDDPNLPFICNSDSCVIEVGVSAGMQALFVWGLQADDAWVEVQTSAGEDGYNNENTTPYSLLIELANRTRHRIPPEWFNFTIKNSGLSILPASYSGGTITDTLTGAPGTVTLSGDLTLGGMLVMGLEDGENYISNTDTGTALGACTIRINLVTSTNVQNSPVSGNNIHQWDSASGSTTGRFEDSSGDAININSFGNIMIGSIVTIASTDYQVIKIVGDGTGTTDITLSGSPADGAITSIKHPIKMGILRAGSILNVENPMIGMAQAFDDYSIRRALVNGGYVQIPRNIAKIFNASINMSDENARDFEGFYYAFRSKPFACLLTQDMPDSTNSKIRNSGFFFIPDPPQISYSSHQGSRSNVQVSFREVL